VTWNFGDGTSSNELTPVHTWENLSDELMSAVVSFEGQTIDGCIGTASATVYIKPQPTAAFEMTVDQGCEPLNTTLINNSENADLFVWSFGNGQTPMSVPTTEDVAMTFDANGEPTAYEITLVAIDALGCTDEQVATVEVLPTPAYAIQLEESESCSPYTAVMPAMEDAMTSFWIFGDGTMSNEVAPAHSWTNNTNDLANHIIEFQGSNAYGCFNTASTSIAVKPQPVADFSTNLDEGCAPLDVVLSNESIRADTFDWNYGDGQTNTFSSTSDHDYTFQGQNVLNTYSISLTATHNLGCSDVKTDSISVFPEVFAAWTGSIEGCAPFETTLEYVGNNIELIQWNMGNGEYINSPEVTTTYNGQSGNDAVYTVGLGVMSEYGCSDMTDVEIVVHPAPLTGLTVSENNSCAETEVLVFNASTYADSVILHLGNGDVLINSALSSIAVEFENETSGDISFLISQEVFTDFGCSASTSIQHTVHPKVTAAFQGPEAACTPSLVGFENQSIHANDGFAWSFGDGTFSNDFAPEHVFASGSTSDEIYTVSLIAMSTAGCTDTTSTQVTVFGTPEAHLSLDSLSGCYPVEVTYANQSEGHTQTSWSYGNGETSSVNDSFHSKVFFNPTADLLTYTTTMTVLNENGCSAEASTSFDVAPHLNAAFDVVSQGCSPVDAQLINQSIGAASFVWNFNDGSLLTNEVNPDHIFVNNTNEDMTFEVELIALSAYGCLDTLTIGVDVYPMPSAEFSVTPVTQTFPNTTVGINNMSAASESAIQYWSFGDGAEIATDQPVFHTYNTWGTYNITLLVDNGFCADAHTQEIQILSPNPVAEFTGGGVGCAPLLVVFENESNHGAGYVWDFGDDYMTSEESPVHVYTRPGVYNVSLTAIGHEGQEHETVHYATVEVFPTAEAAFVFSPSQVVAPDEPVEFVNLSPEGATEFLWTFGDGMVSTEENPIYTYAEPGVYDVSLTANNAFNCPSTFTMEQAVEAIAGGFMEFPTGFTPNNGGSTGGGYDPGSYDNDVFHPYHLGIVEYELVIFNKWGELIFRSTDANIGWDGYFQGRIARQDVYAWRATAQFSNGHRITKAGDVTLIIQ
ncbi:MAG: PKD domain-containing protein, partial [Flavobacteriales bacterium]|nr:PKD domain-containing protein [Flavobacteriales bacterium]